MAAAKALVAPDCAIDFHAGPSEIVVWSDRGRADWIAADLLAQAEHDPDARAVFVTTRATLADRVRDGVTTADAERRTGARRRSPATARSSSRRAARAIELVNRLAPEHLVCDRRADVAGVPRAGTIFVGAWSAQAAGDYCTGSNHVLPTGGAARFRGGLAPPISCASSPCRRLDRDGAAGDRPARFALARAEGCTRTATRFACRMRDL